MLKAILGFLFGKQTDIFNKKGTVQHKFSEKKWDDWEKRLADSPQYNWRRHSGMAEPKTKEKQV